MFLISVDGGTTNTRLVLIRDGSVLDSERLSVGARDSVFNNNVSCAEALAGGISGLCRNNRLAEKDIEAAVVSGMICSEHGLCEVPHISAPVNVASLAAAMRPMRFENISDIPFYLVPGVKTFSGPAELCDMDIMRGEETELYGILRKLNVRGGVTVVLPGSHCKIISVEENGELKRFSTTLSGELIRAAAEQTILRDGIRGAYPQSVDDVKLIEGFDYAAEHGLTEALFKVRILQKFRGYSPDELFAVLCGAILSQDVRAIGNHGGEVLVGGSDPFRSALVCLLRERSDCSPRPIPDDVARFAVAYGAEMLVKERRK